MSNQFYLILGSVGSLIAVLGNLPMIWHLYITKDSTGQSLPAWYVWEVSNLLMLIYAIHINDPVFIALQTAWLIFCGVTIVMVHKYRKLGTK